MNDIENTRFRGLNKLLRSQLVQAMWDKWSDGTFDEFLDDWKWIFSYSRKYWKSIVFYMFLGILSATLSLVSSVASKHLVDIITKRELDKLWILILAMLLPLMVLSIVHSDATLPADDLPLTLTQLTGETGTEREILQEDSSFLCSYVRYWDTGEDDVRITYTIVDVKCPLFYDMLLNEQEQQFMQSSLYSYLPIDGELRDLFGAEYVRHSMNNTGDRWLICWDSRIVYLRASWNLTEEQIAVIAEQLKTQ